MTIQQAHVPRRARLRRAARSVCARAAALVPLALLALLLAGCGSDSHDPTPPVEGPLPTGAEDPRAYTEAFLSRNPKALAQLEHLLVVDLEPTAGDELDTCADRPGIDCIPYTVAEPTEITLSIADALEDLAELVLTDGSGAVVLRAAHGSDGGAAAIAPGDYRLELHHRSPGDDAAPAPMVFLHPAVSSDDGAPNAARIGTAAAHSAVITARNDCVRCNFSGALLEGEHFDGLTLTGSNFNRARVTGTSFRGAKMADCTFLDLLSIYPGGDIRGTSWEMSAIDADFTDAVLSRAKFSLRAMHAPRFHFSGVFKGAHLDGSTWMGKRKSAVDDNVLFNADFRNADLTDSRWEEETTLLRRAVNKPNTPQCTFQGADLTRASFTGKIKDDLSQCRFDTEPMSGRHTVLHGATLSGANLTNVSLANADLSGATLEGTVLEGANLTGADLTGAKVARMVWRGAMLGDAVISDIIPATLNGVDLDRCIFTGVDFDGLDLSRADFSKAVLDASPLLEGATLTDGTVGINLSGHRFADQYDVFEGRDLTGADLTHTELFQAALAGTVLNRAKLVGANLNFANLRGAKLRGATLGIEPGSDGEGATLRGAFMPDVDLTDADLRTVDLTSAHLYGEVSRTLLVRVRLDSATLANAICTGAHFSGTFNNTVFVGAQLINTVFNDATLTGTKFDDAYLEGADFSSARSVRGVVLSNAAVSAAPGTWAFTEQDGTPFTFHYEATQLGVLATDPKVRCPSGALGPCCPSGNLAACLNDKLKPEGNGPFPPVPACVPRAPRYDNCITPMPTRTPRP